MVRSLAILLALVGMSACTYRGGGIDDPVLRKLTYFSYLNGDDLRERCGPGSPNQLRLVYNGSYREQVRAYDVESGAEEGRSNRLITNVIGETDVSRIVLNQPLDIFAPGRGTVVEITPSDAEVAYLVKALADSGAFAAPPVGLELRSEGFYWIFAGCVDGRFRFNAWRWPSDRYDGAQFPAAIIALDTTGIPFNPPRNVFLDPFGPSLRDQRERSFDFGLKVGEEGLFGLTTIDP